MAAPCPAASLPPNSAAICRCSPERHRASLSRSGRLRISSRICHLEPLILEPAVRACRSLKGVERLRVSDFCPLLCNRCLTQRHLLVNPNPSSRLSQIRHTLIASRPPSTYLLICQSSGNFRVSATAPISTVSNQRQEGDLLSPSGHCAHQSSRFILSSSSARGTGR